MRLRLPVLLGLVAASAFGLWGASLGSARGDAASDALAAAVKKGEGLWKKAMATGGKSCAECHLGPNAMKAPRLKAYPKFDKGLNKVVSAQQKLNQMITDKSRATALDLGSEDLNALEAYISTLK